MRSLSRITPSRRLAVALLVVGAVVLMLGGLAWARLSAAAAPPRLLDQAALTRKALDVAAGQGLKEGPTAQKAVMMTLGEWAALNDWEIPAGAAQFGLTPDMPVFVLAMRGSGEYQGEGVEPPPGQTGETVRPHFDHITIVLDARTGDLITSSSGPASEPMKVPVP